MACAVISLLGFLLRGYWMLVGSSWLFKKPVKILPHIVDTALLLSAIAMVVISGQYPFKVDWLTLKVVLLFVYIILGMMALKRGRSKQLRVICFILATLTMFSIFAVAGMKPSF